MLADRRGLYKQIEDKRGSRVLSFITGDRRNAEAQIAQDCVPCFGELLDELDNPKKISLILYTNGGETLAAWSLVNLLREFCDELEVIVPGRCMSSGTLICLGADRIVMAKQSCLGPIDPSINTPLNPKMPGYPPSQRYPLSVEDVAGFMALAKGEGSVPADRIGDAFLKLATDVHPLALGKVKRARGQIQDLARKLLSKHMKDAQKRNKIVKVLCSDAGSHDYSIYRTEARRELGLNIETPSMELYENMRDVLRNARDEMEAAAPFNAGAIVFANNPPVSVPFKNLRVVIETAEKGAFHYITSGNLIPVKDANGNLTVNIDPQRDGYERVP